MSNALFVVNLAERHYFESFIQPSSRKGVEIFVLDPARFPREGLLAIQLSRSGTLSGFLEVAHYDGSDFRTTKLDISAIDLAWYIREAPAPSGAKSVEERFATNETRGALYALLSTLNCRWINRRETIHQLASNKLYQQMVAQRCGLAIPRTLISNDPDSVSSFSDPTEGLLLKSIGYIRLDDEGLFHLYSERFGHEELTGATEAIRGCPIFCQEYVPKRFEHRVMVIGKRVLACQIDSQASPRTRVDWRHYDFDRVAHTHVELPSTIQVKLRSFMDAIGLKYGAIDLIERPDGEYVFLEVNPSGQWGWISEFAGLPIAEAVADMLAD